MYLTLTLSTFDQNTMCKCECSSLEMLLLGMSRRKCHYFQILRRKHKKCKRRTLKQGWVSQFQGFPIGQSLKGLSAICARSSTTVRICGLWAPLSRELSQNGDNVRHSWTLVHKHLTLLTFSLLISEAFCFCLISQRTAFCALQHSENNLGR